MGIADRAKAAIVGFFERETAHQDLQRGIGADMIGLGGAGALRPVVGMGSGTASLLYDFLTIETNLIRRYSEYEEMDDYPEIQTCLDLYADDATMDDPTKGASIWVDSQRNASLAKELNGRLRKIRASEDAWAVDRSLCKYGQVFGEPILTKEEGLVGMSYLPAPTMRRIEGPREGVLGFVQDVSGMSLSYSHYDFLFRRYLERKQGRGVAMGQGGQPNGVVLFDPWEVVHWRLTGKHLRSIYGYPIIEAARGPWKRLSMLEDALLVAKFERTPARYVYYVNVGSMNPKRAQAYMRQVRDKVHRHKVTSPSSQSAVDLRYNAIAQDEDFYIPVRNQQRTTEIEVLNTPDYTEVESLDYFRKKLVVSVKVPPSFMGWSDEGARSMLSSEDIRFARAVMRVQKAHVEGYEESLKLHLAATGREGKGGWTVKMAVPSQILELARMEVLSAKADVSQRMKEDVGSKYVLVNIMGMDESEAERVMDERLAEREKEGMLDVKLRRAEMAEAAPAEAALPLSSPLAESLSRLDPPANGLPVGGSSRDWRRDFEGGRGRKPSVDEVRSVLKSDPELRRRLNRLEGLVRDIKSAMRGYSRYKSPTIQGHPTIDE